MTETLTVTVGDTEALTLDTTGTDTILVTPAPGPDTITITGPDDNPITVTVVEGTETIVVEGGDPEPIAVTIGEPDTITIDLDSGEGGSPASWYRHTQTAPASTWTIAHSLGYRPAVSLEDFAGSLFEADVDYPDDATVVVHLSAAIGGYANLS